MRALLFPRGRPHREVFFRRRCSLSFIISLISAAGRISIVPHSMLHSRTLGNELNCVIQISRFKHLKFHPIVPSFPRTDRLSLTFPFFQPTVTAVLAG